MEQTDCLDLHENKHPPAEKPQDDARRMAQPVKRKPRGDLEKEQKEHHKVRDGRQGGVSHRIGRLFLEKEVELQAAQHVLPLPPGERDDDPPACILIAGKHPVDPDDHAQEEDVGRHEMEEPHPSHDVLVRGYRVHERVPDVDTRDAEDHDAQGVDPVGEAHREFPCVDPYSVRLHGPPPFYTTLIRVISFPSGSTTWTAQAMHGSKEWTVLKIST